MNVACRFAGLVRLLSSAMTDEIFMMHSIRRRGIGPRFPAFWGHDARKVRAIAQRPNNNLAIRTKPVKGRKLKDARAIWQQAGPLLLAERIRFNTHRCIALGFEQAVLGNTWWFGPY